jgi:hypothetical protein
MFEKMVLTGLPFAKVEDRDTRESICLSCDNLLLEEKRCNLCNCYLPLKIYFKSALCPAGKWPPLNT